jgi:CDP-diacylglycerol pyrophosphatase
VTVPRQDLSLAVNSAAGRSMHQLHIHVDCVRLDVRQALHAHDGEISEAWTSIADAKWAEFSTTFAGHHYHVRWVDGPDLDAVNLFRLVADRDADTGGDMAMQTIVVVGGPERHHLPGFYVLTDQVHINWGKSDPVADDAASGEELMDHQGCPALKVPPPP